MPMMEAQPDESNQSMRQSLRRCVRHNWNGFPDFIGKGARHALQLRFEEVPQRRT
jgi:hypothetical protein